MSHPSSAAGEHHAEHQLEVNSDTATVVAAAREVASDWGAWWEGEGQDEGGDLGDNSGRLTIPILAGLRYGQASGQLSVEPARAGGMPAGVRVRFTVEEESYTLQKISVAILLCAAFGCLIVLFWPFFPALASLIPLSLVLGLAAWFLVIAKLSNSGPPEFLQEIAERASRGDDG